MSGGLKGADVLFFVLLDIALILVAARTVGRTFERIGQPRVVGEIVAGILLGPTILGFQIAAVTNASWLRCEAARSFVPPGGPPPAQPPPPTLTECLFPAQSRGVLAIIGSLALALFMFLVGSQLDTDRLRGLWPSISVASVLAVGIPIAAAFAITPVLFTDRFAATDVPRLAFTAYIAAILAVTAFPVMVRILQELGMDRTKMGGVGIASAAVITVLMFLLLNVANGIKQERGATSLLATLAMTVLYVGVMLFVVRPLLAGRANALIGPDGTIGMAAIVWLVVLVAASCVISDRLGLGPIVGGFLAGVALPRTAGLGPQLDARLQPITVGVMLPIFLAFSGLNTNLRLLGWAWMPGIVALLVAAIACKWLSGLVGGRLTGMTWAEGNLLGVLFNCRGLLVLVVALAALQQKAITPQLQAAAVLVALVTTMMTGPLAAWAGGKLTESRIEEGAAS